MHEPQALVTGGCGFVGRHFVRRLLRDGYRVTVVDDLSSGIPPARWPAHLRVGAAEAKRFVFHHADVRDYLRGSTAAFDLIVHLAAVVGGRLTIEGDPLRVATDLAIDATFFNWAAALRPRPNKVLFFSSSAVYPVSAQRAGSHRPLPESLVDFDRPQLGIPDMTYGWAKLTGEYLARHAAAAYGLDVVVFRPFSGYGEDQDFTYPFPSIVRRIGRRENPVTVWGSGEQQRDFIYIEDVVEAVFKSLAHLAPGEALNLGSGVGTSFRELARTACRVIGHAAEVVNDPAKPEGVFGRVGDCTRMLSIHRPQVSLEEGIRIVYAHQLAAGLLEGGP